MCTATYYLKLVSEFASMTDPLRRLLKKTSRGPGLRSVNKTDKKDRSRLHPERYPRQSRSIQRRSERLSRAFEHARSGIATCTADNSH